MSKTISPRTSQLGGIDVRRLLPKREQRMVGPWIFFDEMGPAAFSPGQGINVPPHPHIGLATVTYLFDGEMLHRDSLGSEQVIQPGDVNLMVAGRGITHSERERPDVTGQAHRLHGLQLWFALPVEHEQCDPAFYHVASHEMPMLTIDDVPVRVMIGEAYGAQSPVPTFSETLYLEAKLLAGQCLALPKAAQLGVYLVSGGLTYNEHTLDAQTFFVFDDDAQGELLANDHTHLVFIGGAGVGERYIDWNFVASDKALIEQAYQDWDGGRFASVVGEP